MDTLSRRLFVDFNALAGVGRRQLFIILTTDTLVTNSSRHERPSISVSITRKSGTDREAPNLAPVPPPYFNMARSNSASICREMVQITWLACARNVPSWKCHTAGLIATAKVNRGVTATFVAGYVCFLVLTYFIPERRRGTELPARSLA